MKELAVWDLIALVRASLPPAESCFEGQVHIACIHTGLVIGYSKNSFSFILPLR